MAMARMSLVPRATSSIQVGWAVLVAALLAFGLVGPAWACTTFHLARSDGEHAIGNSYDWSIGDGLLVVNKRGVAKTALVMPGESPAEWTSVYGSITFNQYGRENPTGGMNEAGLVVAQMWLFETECPSPDERPAVSELVWIQHALDSYGSVAELVAEAAQIRVAPFFADIHYLACDDSGDCAAFEYLEGELVITEGADLMVHTLTNDTYGASIDYLVQHQGFGGESEIPDGSSSLDRFVRASALALEEVEGELPSQAFAILDSVAQGPSSQWNIVYLPSDGRIYFRTYTTPAIKYVDLAELDLDCTDEVAILDMDSDLEGDVTDALVPYDLAANLDLVQATMAEIADNFPPGTINALAAYPDSLVCTIESVDGGPDGDPGLDGGPDGSSPDADPAADGGYDGAADAGPDEGSDGDGCSCSAPCLRGQQDPLVTIAGLVGLAALLARRRGRPGSFSSRE